MNIPHRVIEIIMECVTTASLQVLWNGEKIEPVKPSRGLRQGDPLSPYHFVLCMERINQVIEEVEGRWKPVYGNSGGPLLSTLFFADDIILSAEASSDLAKVIKDCLDRFCAALG